MSPTTSANSVSLYLRPSRIALGVQLAVGWLILWSVLLSPAPVVPVLFLFGVIGQNYRHFFPSEYSGVFRLRNTGWLVVETKTGEKEERQLTSVVTLFNPVMVRIGTENSRTIRIWRDSCAEADYRHLLVVLRYLDEQ